MTIKKIAWLLGKIVAVITSVVVAILGGFIIANRAWNYYLDTHCVSGFGSFSNGCVNDSQSP